MKPMIILLLTICSAFTVTAQDKHFSNVAIANQQNRSLIAFSVPNEINVRHYRIEASDDSVNFDVITTLNAKGNSLSKTSYNFDISAYKYTYYRIAIVGMNGIMPCSGIIAASIQKSPDSIQQSENIKQGKRITIVSK